MTVDALPQLLDAAQRMGYTGLNITHPCKQRVIEHLDALSDDARALGAVDGSWSARLLEAATDGLLAMRAGFSIDPSTQEGELRTAELELVRFVFRGGPRPPERDCLSRLPAVDADVMSRAVTRRASVGGAS